MEESSRDMPWLSPILPVHCYLFLLSGDIGTSGWLNGPLGTFGGLAEDDRENSEPCLPPLLDLRLGLLYGTQA